MRTRSCWRDFFDTGFVVHIHTGVKQQPDRFDAVDGARQCSAAGAIHRLEVRLLRQ